MNRKQIKLSLGDGFAQKVNKRVGVGVSEPEAVATGQKFNFWKLSKSFDVWWVAVRRLP
jgi:hypothetical protein